MKRVLFTLLIGLGIYVADAQEMKVDVTINTPQLQLVDPVVFEDMESNLENFLNNQKWTNDVFEIEEQIRVNIQINIREETSATSFKGEMQIQAVRPVYGTNYETVILSHQDKDFAFNYEQFQPLEYASNTYRSNLEAFFSFYVFYIIGLDYDSFSLYGGEEYFQLAQAIMNNIPSNAAAQFPGWRSLDGNRNRYWMIENMLNPRVRPMRKALYEYHRQGLDLMSNDIVSGRAIMTKAIQDIAAVDKSYPNSMVIRMFVNAKANEIVEIFKEADRSQKSTIKSSMTRMDASNASKYREIGS